MPDYDNSGILFQEPANENPKAPQYKGKLTVAGVEYYISGWKKQGRQGPFLSLSVTPKDGQRRSYTPPADDEELPF